MALFGKKQKKQEKAADSETNDGAQVASPSVVPVEEVLRQPRITEKAAMGTENNVYVFNIDPTATKSDIKRAVRRLYNVTPRKVNVATVPAKNITRRGIPGRKGGGKKAYVYLKEGDKIELM